MAGLDAWCPPWIRQVAEGTAPSDLAGARTCLQHGDLTQLTLSPGLAHGTFRIAPGHNARATLTLPTMTSRAWARLEQRGRAAHTLGVAEWEVMVADELATDGFRCGRQCTCAQRLLHHPCPHPTAVGLALLRVLARVPTLFFFSHGAGAAWWSRARWTLAPWWPAIVDEGRWLATPGKSLDRQIAWSMPYDATWLTRPLEAAPPPPPPRSGLTDPRVPEGRRSGRPRSESRESARSYWLGEDVGGSRLPIETPSPARDEELPAGLWGTPPVDTPSAVGRPADVVEPVPVTMAETKAGEILPPPRTMDRPTTAQPCGPRAVGEIERTGADALPPPRGATPDAASWPIRPCASHRDGWAVAPAHTTGSGAPPVPTVGGPLQPLDASGPSITAERLRALTPPFRSDGSDRAGSALALLYAALALDGPPARPSRPEEGTLPLDRSMNQRPPATTPSFRPRLAAADSPEAGPAPTAPGHAAGDPAATEEARPEGAGAGAPTSPAAIAAAVASLPFGFRAEELTAWRPAVSTAPHPTHAAAGAGSTAAAPAAAETAPPCPQGTRQHLRRGG